VCDRVVILHHGRSVFGDTIDGLKKFHGGRIVYVGLRQPPPADVLASIPGVARVEADGANGFRVSFADNADPTDALVRRAVEQSWGLFQLVPAQTSVEEVFVQLTRKDEAAA
jgi:ABC-2 type transport system ATP-binding protein